MLSVVNTAAAGDSGVFDTALPNEQTVTAKAGQATKDGDAASDPQPQNGRAPEANGATPRDAGAPRFDPQPLMPSAPSVHAAASTIGPVPTLNGLAGITGLHIAASARSGGATVEPGVPLAGLAVEIASRALEGKQRFDIRLDPPDLGRIDVRLDVGRDGQVTSRLVVERSDTLDLLRRDAPALERALQAAGLRTDNSAMEFSLRDQSGGQRQPPEHLPRPNLLIVPDEDVAVREAVRRGYGVLRGLGGGLDIRV